LQNYAVTLAQQLGKLTTDQALGLKLHDQQLGELRDDQIGQLFELFQEIQKASDGGTTTDVHADESDAKSALPGEDGTGLNISAVDCDPGTSEDKNKSGTTTSVGS